MNVEKTVKKIVTEDMLAVNVGSGSLKVLGTPVVAALFAVMVADLDGAETVGTVGEAARVALAAVPPARAGRSALYDNLLLALSDAERIFAALSEGGQVTMALDQTFWAVRFGMLVDKFGVPWMINCEKDA